MEDLYEPITFRSPNECPKCGKSGMVFLSLEIDNFKVQSNGSMEYLFTSGGSYLYTCPHCHYADNHVVKPMHGPIRLASVEDGYIYPSDEDAKALREVNEKTFKGNPFVIDG